MTTKGPDACLRATLTPIRLLAGVITISCLLYSALVTLWWYYFEYIPTIISSLHFSGSANFDGFISVRSCFSMVKFKNLYQFNPRSYDMGDYIQNIDPCKTWQQLDNGLYIYIYRYVRHTLVARSWGDVMWEELSDNHFLNIVTIGNGH